jgi:surface protein
MFGGCSSLESINLSGLDTSMVTNMCNMFSGCSSLESLNLSSFDTSKVTSMGYMFSSCTKLASLDVSSFDTSKVTDMSCMFSGCSSLTSLNLGGCFNTSNVTYMGHMFYNCSSLTSLDLGEKFSTSNVTDMSSMFSACTNLALLDFGETFNTSNVTNMSEMFYGCSALTSLDLSSFDTSRATTMSGMFNGDSSLREIKLSEGFSFYGYGSDQSSRLCSLPTPSGDSCVGTWLSSADNVAYAADNVPFNVAATYVAAVGVVPPSAKSVVYNGENQIGVAAGDKYSVTGGSATDIGSYTATASLSDKTHYVWTTTGQTGDLNINWAISKVPVQTPSAASLTYNGKEQTGVAAGEGYTVTGGLATDPGTYTATLSLVDKANTAWSTTGTSDDIEVSWSISEPDYTWCVDDGNQELSISLNTTSWVSWSLSDYSVASIVSTSSSSTSWGSYQRQVAGVTISPDKEGYTELTASVNGSVVSRTTIRVTPSKRIDISSADVSGLESSYAYTGSAIAPALTVTVDGKALTQDGDYTVSFSGNVNAGTATAYVSGINNYRGSITKTFQIAKADPSYTAPTGIVAVVGQTLADVTLPEGFSWQDDAATSVGAAGTHTFKATYTPSDTANYNVVRDIEVSVTVSAAPVDISSAAVEVVGGPFTYSGKAIEPDVNVTLNGKKLVKGADYKVSYANNVNVGTATATVEGIGAYSGTVSKTFQIMKAESTPDQAPDQSTAVNISKGKAEVSGSAVYMGRAVEPGVTVTVGGKTLAAGTDYTVSYSGNEGFGTGRATVTGKGNYAGTLTADFAITSDVVNVFSDASHEDWYVESGALDYAYAHGLISGYSGTDLVGAYDLIKRQDVAVILWRMAGEPEVAAGDSFEDVDYNDYYGPAVRWARATGVINGYRDADGTYRTFGPSDLVTREQLAAMIANYAEKIGGMTVASDCAKLDALPDAGEVSDWARASVGWCMDNDIMNGVNVEGTAYAQPAGNAWRASMASMAAVLHRDVLKLG